MLVIMPVVMRMSVFMIVLMIVVVVMIVAVHDARAVRQDVDVFAMMVVFALDAGLAGFAAATGYAHVSTSIALMLSSSPLR